MISFFSRDLVDGVLCIKLSELVSGMYLIEVVFLLFAVEFDEHRENAAAVALNYKMLQDEI
jgi:hypothetical protein